ncbi:Nucleolar protein Nop52, partial [Phytophthora infestans]
VTSRPLAAAPTLLYVATMENAASRFGQHLAHTEKKYRDRALKKLTVYLTKKTEWTELEWDKLWKALFYCMWMSDKRPVQEELSTNLAGLVHRIPTAESALEFVHSFFRTMHREWHGLDGLRLDKFYSLVRKFVRETVVLLRDQDWEEELVQEFVTILSTEVVSQLPNGLRMHLADLYLTEIHNAAGKDVTTEAFMTLLEPFFTLLNSEYDKTVFKRVRELVFEEMLTKYKFGAQPEKEKDQEDEEETDDEEEEDKVFEQVDVAQVQHRIFAIASADDTAERNRAALYTLYKKFFTLTHIDSFQAAQEEAAKPKKTVKKEKKDKTPKEEPVVSEAAKDDEVGETKKSKKSKKRKAKKIAEGQVETTKIEDAKEVQTETSSPKKKIKKQKVAAEVKTEDVEMKSPSAETEKSKKQKKQKKEKQPEPKKLDEKPAKNTPVKEDTKLKQEKKKETYTSVVKSGKRFKRCGSCGGFGKGLVPKDKTLCGHCERSQKTQKKKAASASKKRKAESQAQAAREEQEKADASKKVTFGKSKALRHEVSVKRLKASAKRDAVSKDTEDIKGVLKVTTPSPVASKKSKKSKAKGRKAAADFM